MSSQRGEGNAPKPPARTSSEHDISASPAATLIASSGSGEQVSYMGDVQQSHQIQTQQAPSVTTSPTQQSINPRQQYHPNIPPPPKAGEKPQQTQHGHAAYIPQHPLLHQHENQRPPNLSSNLEHPPGYIQNPRINDATSTSPPTFDTSRGAWRWEDAPGGAGGRYADGYDGYDYGEEEWFGSDLWEGAVEWAKFAGNKLVQAEEGVWRWVNGR